MRPPIAVASRLTAEAGQILFADQAGKGRLHELSIVFDPARGEAGHHRQQQVRWGTAGIELGEREIKRRREHFGQPRVGDWQAAADAGGRVQAAGRFAGFPGEFHEHALVEGGIFLRAAGIAAASILLRVTNWRAKRCLQAALVGKFARCYSSRPAGLITFPALAMSR